jgi:phenylalanine-4-hydroxylase
MRNITNKEIIEQLGRLYWFTIEFGLIMEGERPKIYGAGLISSFGESLHVFSDKVSHYLFDFNEIINKPFNNSVKQNEYFILKDWEELYTCLEGIEEKNSIATA